MLDHHFEILKKNLRIVVSLDEDGIQLLPKQYNSYSITNELLPGIYTIKDISKDF